MQSDNSIDTQDWQHDDFSCESFDSNLFLLKLENSSKLKVLLEKRVEKMARKHNKLGLLYLFFTRTYINSIRTWSNENLASNGYANVNEDKFNAYIGLELATSIVQLNRLNQYWSTKMFHGNNDFKNVMSRDDFKLIRRHLTLVSPNSVSQEKKAQDPLWHSRSLMEHFEANCVSVAVPEGTLALDEASLATKARTLAKTYNASKPAKYAIRFYAVVGNCGPYIFSLQDNKRGNKQITSAALDYSSRQFPYLRGPFYKHINEDSELSPGTPSALWAMMMAHSTKKSVDPSGKRFYFMDNYYTRHILAEQLKKLTDGEAMTIGTVKFTNIDGTNRVGVTNGLNIIKKADRGEWCLVPAFNKHPDLDKLKREHQSKMRTLDKKDRYPFEYPRDHKADKSGYILWKDSKVVIFYANCLKSTPSQSLLMGSSDEVIKCVHGLAVLNRWTGDETMSRSSFKVPAIIVAYNRYMNGVDRADQLRMVNPTKRKEKRLYMNIFTYMLDLGIVNAYTLYKEYAKLSNDYDFSEFKRDICECLVTPYLESKKSVIKNKADKQSKSIMDLCSSSEDESEELVNSPTNAYIGDVVEEDDVGGEEQSLFSKRLPSDYETTVIENQDLSDADEDTIIKADEYRGKAPKVPHSGSTITNPWSDKYLETSESQQQSLSQPNNLLTQPDIREKDSSTMSGVKRLRNTVKVSANKTQHVKKNQMGRERRITYDSDSSISTEEPFELPFNQQCIKVPENISYVSEQFRAVGAHNVRHMLVDNTGDNKQVPCFFCKIVTGKRSRVSQGCTNCKKAFHTNCFTAFHCSGMMNDNIKELAGIVHAAVKAKRSGPKMPSKYVGNMDEFNLKCFRNKDEDE